MSDTLWIVEIVEDATATVVRRWTADNFRRAEKIADGAAINLDHDRFSVTITRDGGDT